MGAVARKARDAVNRKENAMSFNRVFFATAVAAFTVLLAPAVSRAADPRAMLAQHESYVGHPAGIVVTYQYEPPVRPSAAPSPAASPEPTYAPVGYTTYRRGELYRTVTGAEGVENQNGYTGRAFWRANENNYVSLVLENDARRALTDNLVDTGAFGSAQVQDRGSQTIDGKQVQVVRVTPAGGVPADIAIDPTNGAFVQVNLDPDDGRFIEHIEGYTEIAPGVRVPTAYRYGRNQRYVFRHGEVKTVADSDLKAPTPTATWSFGSGAEVPITVEQRTRGGRAVIIQAAINGHVGRFLLDSGAGQLLLYQPYAGRLGLTKLGNTRYGGVAGGSRSASWARANTIAVGDNTLSNVIVTMATASDRGGLDGILGYDLLAGAVVHVNLADKVIAFADPAKVQPVVGKGAYAFPVNLADGVPEIALKVGDVPTRAIFDTGDDFFATLSDNLKTSGRLVALPEELKFGSFSVDMHMYFVGVDGVTPEPESCHRLREISIGPYRYQNVTTCFASQRVFGKDGGLVGFDFLRHFNWTFDYTRSRLVLTPNGL